MEVIAFVGPAGTGKSYRAQKIARDVGADAIIDDGLLIQGNKIRAGSSAKNEQNRIQAVKRAIFNDPEQIKTVKAALAELPPERLLILGTSEAMAKRIALKLSLPEPSRYIKIEEVSTKREIARARESRYREGKHIVPVATVELKPHYSGYLIDPFRGFFSKNKSSGEHMEKSIVRPTFSMYGKMFIADSAIEDIVTLTLAEIKEIKSVLNVTIKTGVDKSRSVSINVELVLLYGPVIKEIVRQAQTFIKQQVEAMTAMNVLAVNISIRRLVLQ